MTQSSESFHDKKEKLRQSAEDSRSSRLSSDLERLSRMKAQGEIIPAVDIKPSGPLDADAPYLCIKGAFRTRAAEGPRGLFVLLAHGTSGETVFLSLWAGYGGVRNADLQASWQALSVLAEEETQPQDRHLREAAVFVLREVFNPPMINRLATDPENPERMKKAESRFLTDLSKALDQTFEGALVMELGSGREPQKFLDSRSAQPEELDASPREDKKTAEIRRLSVLCGAIIDPVRGKPVSSLEIGERIYVLVKGGSAIAHAIRKIMARGRIDRIPAPVISIESTSTGNVEIFVELSEGVYGKLLAADTYKIAVPSGSGDDGKGPLPIPGAVWFALYTVVILMAALIILLR